MIRVPYLVTRVSDILGRVRPPRPYDQSADTDQLQEDWASALEELLADWEQISRDQRDELVDQVRAAIDDDDWSALAALNADTSEADDVLAAAMIALAETAAEGMATEAAAQGVSVAAGTVDAAELGAYAATVTALLAGGLALAAGAEALRVLRPGVEASVVAEHVREHLDGLSDAYLTERLGGALSAAQNTGRFATLAVAPVAVWEASEANDVNTCGPCDAIDGTEFPTIDAAIAVYGLGGYPGCLGRWRCRGTVTANWEDT